MAFKKTNYTTKQNLIVSDSYMKIEDMQIDRTNGAAHIGLSIYKNQDEADKKDINLVIEKRHISIHGDVFIDEIEKILKTGGNFLKTLYTIATDELEDGRISDAK